MCDSSMQINKGHPVRAAARFNLPSIPLVRFLLILSVRFPTPLQLLLLRLHQSLLLLPPGGGCVIVPFLLGAR